MEGLTDCLKCHHEMPYFKKEKAQNGKLVLRKKGSHPVMLAKVISPTGSPVGLHRTYLTKDGKKAPYAKTKKLMEGLGLHGGAIRLYPITSAVMGVAEGIETSIAAHALTGVPTWATISSTIMEGFEPPAEVKLVVIFVDHDQPDREGGRQDSSRQKNCGNAWKNAERRSSSQCRKTSGPTWMMCGRAGSANSPRTRPTSPCMRMQRAGG